LAATRGRGSKFSFWSTRTGIISAIVPLLFIVGAIGGWFLWSSHTSHTSEVAVLQKFLNDTDAFVVECQQFTRVQQTYLEQLTQTGHADPGASRALQSSSDILFQHTSEVLTAFHQVPTTMAKVRLVCLPLKETADSIVSNANDYRQARNDFLEAERAGRNSAEARQVIEKYLLILERLKKLTENAAAAAALGHDIANKSSERVMIDGV
jgi:hypothetical protein